MFTWKSVFIVNKGYYLAKNVLLKRCIHKINNHILCFMLCFSNVILISYQQDVSMIRKNKKNEKAFFLLPQTNLKYTGLSETTLVIEIKGCWLKKRGILRDKKL